MLYSCWCAGLFVALPAAGEEATTIYPNVVAVGSGASLPVGLLGVGLGGGIRYGRRGILLENLVVGGQIGYDYFWGQVEQVEELQILSLSGWVGYMLPVTPLLRLEPRLSYGYGYNILTYAASQEAVDRGEFATEGAAQPEFGVALDISIALSPRWGAWVAPEYRVIFEPNEFFPLFGVRAGARFLLPDRAPTPLPVVPAQSQTVPMDALQAIVAEDTSVERTEQEITIDIRIFFDPLSAELEGDALGQLDRLAAGLADFRTNQITILGHVADIGDSTLDMELSQQRAEAVRVYLIDVHGFDPFVLRAEGRGATEPAADNATEEGRARNRRVEVIVELARQGATPSEGEVE